MGQIFAYLLFYLTAYFIRKNYISITIAFVLVLFSIYGSGYDSDTKLFHLNYNYALGSFVINVIFYGIFFKIVSSNRRSKLNSGEIIDKNQKSKIKNLKS